MPESQMLREYNHQVRNTLGPLLSMVDLMSLGMFGVLSVEQKEALVRMQQSARRMQMFTEEIGLLAQIRRGDIVSQQMSCLSADILTSVIDRLQPQDVPRSLDITVAPNRIVLDVFVFEEIARRVISNAFRYVAPGGVIKILCSTTDKYVILRVANPVDGSAYHSLFGVSLPSLLDPFVSMHECAGRFDAFGTGAGLGLAIVAALCESFGGSVILSTQDLSFEVVVVLPLGELP